MVNTLKIYISICKYFFHIILGKSAFLAFIKITEKNSITKLPMGLAVKELK